MYHGRASAPKFDSYSVYAELLSAHTLRLTGFNKQKSFDIDEGYNYFDLISFKKLNKTSESDMVLKHKFVLRIEGSSSGFGAGGLAIRYDSREGLIYMDSIAIGSEYGGYFPKSFKYAARIERDE